MVGLGSSVGRTLTLTVGLNCLHQLPAIVRVYGSSEESYLKNYLVIFCMYVFRRFHLHLSGAILPALIIDPRSFFSVSGGRGRAGAGNIPWDFTRMLATNLCVMYFICYD